MNTDFEMKDFETLTRELTSRIIEQQRQKWEQYKQDMDQKQAKHVAAMEAKIEEQQTEIRGFKLSLTQKASEMKKMEELLANLTDKLEQQVLQRDRQINQQINRSQGSSSSSSYATAVVSNEQKERNDRDERRPHDHQRQQQSNEAQRELLNKQQQERVEQKRLQQLNSRRDQEVRQQPESIFIRGVRSSLSLSSNTYNLRKLLVTDTKIMSNELFQKCKEDWRSVSHKYRNNTYDHSYSTVVLKLPSVEEAKEVLRKKREVLDQLKRANIYIMEYLSNEMLAKRKQETVRRQEEKDLEYYRRPKELEREERERRQESEWQSARAWNSRRRL
jgi:hypothetical protein